MSGQFRIHSSRYLKVWMIASWWRIEKGIRRCCRIVLWRWVSKISQLVAGSWVRRRLRISGSKIGRIWPRAWPRFPSQLISPKRSSRRCWRSPGVRFGSSRGVVLVMRYMRWISIAPTPSTTTTMAKRLFSGNSRARNRQIRIYIKLSFLRRIERRMSRWWASRLIFAILHKVRNRARNNSYPW